MFAISEKISRLLTPIVYSTTKSKRSFTPNLFANPKLTPRGLFQKPQRSYDYNLPESLPNRHLYWDRKVQNKLLRKRYNEERMRKLNINPIHDANGKRTYNRSCNEITAELTSLNIIRQSINRTFVNIHECLIRFPQRFLGNGPDADVFHFVFKELHDRHLPSMSFYLFSNFCQMRQRAKYPPTQQIMLHFYKFIEAACHNPNPKLTVERLGQLSNYIFSRAYPECQNLVSKKQITFQIFEEGVETFKTFDDILCKLFTPDQIKDIATRVKSNDKKVVGSLEGIMKIPGSHKLVEIINQNK